MTRAKPYSASGIRRIPCARCGQPSHQQWQICADGNRYRGICVGCDVALNDLVLRFVKDPERQTKMRKYREKVGA